KGNIDAEGQKAHGVLRSRCATSRPPSGSKGTSAIREVLTLCRLTAGANRGPNSGLVPAVWDSGSARGWASPSSNSLSALGKRGQRHFYFSTVPLHSTEKVPSGSAAPCH